jgi:hypothetical protein
MIMLLKVTPSTWQDVDGAPVVLKMIGELNVTGVERQASAHAGNAASGIVISAAATPISDLTFSIVSSSEWSRPRLAATCSSFAGLPLGAPFDGGTTRLGIIVIFNPLFFGQGRILHKGGG